MPNQFASELLEASSRAYAAYAVEALFARDPGAREQFEPASTIRWQEQVAQLLHDLATAARFRDPTIFSAKIEWTRQAFDARGVPDSHLRTAIECLGEVLDQELPEAAASHVSPIVRAALRSFDRPAGEFATKIDPGSVDGRLALEYLDRILDGDRRSAIGVLLDAAAAGRTPQDLFQRVLMPAMEEVGRMWHTGEVAVFEEHFATDTMRALIPLLSRLATPREPHGKCVIVGASAGNRHDTAVRLAAEFFELDGWRTIGLGADVPSEEFPDAIAAFGADLIAIGATLTTQLSPLDSAIRAIRADERTARTQVLVGGRAFLDSPELWKALAANAFARDVAEAPAIGRRLLGLPA